MTTLHTEDWREREKATYEKWASEHPDVNIVSANTDPSWWVRNYVETRLFSLLAQERTLAKEERDREILAALVEREKELENTSKYLSRDDKRIVYQRILECYRIRALLTHLKAEKDV